MSKFKPGDIVICTNPCPDMDLHSGFTYTVNELRVGGTLSIKEIPKASWSLDRFELVHPRQFSIATNSAVYADIKNEGFTANSGAPAIAGGFKNDSEKPDMSLLSTIAMVKTAEVMTFGKKKYSAHNWRGGLSYSRLIAAAMRHITAFNGGQDKDPETGLSHLAHAQCCIMMLLEFEDTQPSLDDRYKASK